LCILVVQYFLALFHKVLSDGVVWSLAKMCKAHSVTVKIGFCAKVQMAGCCAKMVGFVPSLRQYHVSGCVIAQMVRCVIMQVVNIKM